MSLYIVATPIGNLGDISPRASKVFSEVNAILAEDTRVSRTLMVHLGVTTPMIAYHDFNKEKVAPGLITRMKQGEKFALITDAGTPGIADPAFYIVRAAIRENLQVIPIPGPTAFIAALVCSGLPTDRFIFENFLAHKSSQRKRLFETLKNEPRTVIFYETPHRILKTLNEIDEVLGDILVVIGRELTKIHEEFLRGSAKELLAHFVKRPPKGEMTVMFNTRFRMKDLSILPTIDPSQPSEE